MKRHLLAAVGAAFCLWTSSAAGAPRLSAVIPSTEPPGAASRGYPFFAAGRDLAALGYVEEERFLEGEASEYSTPYAAAAFVTGRVLGSPRHYRTRLIVRRPADPARFNGVVIVEWTNVSNGFDSPNIWLSSREHLIDAGYAWVGVTAQGFGGVEQLKAWNRHRYGGLEIPNGGKMAAESLSLDIFAQAGRAIRGEGVINGPAPRVLIAAGQSQAANWLISYINGQLPTDSFDGFLLLSPSGVAVNPEATKPVFKVLAEGDIRGNAAALVEPDRPMFRKWEVAGTSHVDRNLRAGREPLELRDLGVSVEARIASQCKIKDIGTATPMRHVLAAAIDHLANWALGGGPPPVMAPLARTTNAEQAIALDLDDGGQSRGGVRLAAASVPSGLNLGVNSGSPACVLQGSYQPYDAEKLHRLYGSHKAYVGAVARATRANLDQGVVTRAGAAEIIEEARALQW